MNNTRPIRSLRVYLGVAVSVVIATVCAVDAANYTLAVNATNRTQQWNRYYEKSISTCHMYTVLHSYWGRGIAGQLKFANQECGFQTFRGHGILDADVGLVTSASATSLVLNWTNFDAIYDAGHAAHMWPILEVGFTPPALASGTATVGLWYDGVSPNMTIPNKYGWGKWMDLMDSIVLHVENRYGVDTVRQKWYFEVWNEASWMYSGGEAGYQTLYDYTVTGLLKADPNLKVGGPAYSAPSSIGGIPSLINHCLTGTNAATGTVGTKLDFVSYHRYGNDNTGGCATGYANTASVNCFHKQMVTAVKGIPAYKGELINDEWGPNSQIHMFRDWECTASMIAKIIHLINENGAAYPPPSSFGFWALSDIYEENQNHTDRYTFAEATQGILLRGDPADSNSWNIGKPSFNAFRLMHKLGAWEVSCTGGTTGDGVNAVATASANNDSLQILVYNHLDAGIDDADGGTAMAAASQVVDNVALTVSNIPFAPGLVRAEHWVVDYSHSNAYRPWKTMGSPAKPTGAQWLTLKQAAMLTHYDSVATTTLTTNTWTKNFTQNHYSVGLIQITRGPTAIFGPSGKNNSGLDAFRSVSAKVKGQVLHLDIPSAGAYEVRLFTTSGRQIMEKRLSGPGETSISLKSIPAGAYMLQCVSKAKTLEMPLMVGK